MPQWLLLSLASRYIFIDQSCMASRSERFESFCTMARNSWENFSTSTCLLMKKTITHSRGLILQENILSTQTSKLSRSFAASRIGCQNFSLRLERGVSLQEFKTRYDKLIWNFTRKNNAIWRFEQGNFIKKIMKFGYAMILKNLIRDIGVWILVVNMCTARKPT